jgi:hypothetical protein
MNDDIRHYGVIGMKWGVRRGNYSKTYAKSSKKLKKLDEKAAKKRLESAKLAKKALAKEANATSEKQYRKAREKQFKANKLNLKSAKLQKKAMKFEKQMAKSFANVKIKDIEQKDLELGKKYAYMLASNAGKTKKKTK